LDQRSAPDAVIDSDEIAAVAAYTPSMDLIYIPFQHNNAGSKRHCNLLRRETCMVEHLFRILTERKVEWYNVRSANLSVVVHHRLIFLMSTSKRAAVSKRVRNNIV
jgi:hypothetical protein